MRARRSRWPACCWLLLGSIAVLVTAASAAAEALLDVQPLAERADHLLVALVIETGPRTVTFAALRYLKSSSFESRLTAVIGDHDPALAVGERVLVGLAERAGQARRIVDLFTRRADLDDLEPRLRRVIRVPPPAYGGALLLEAPVGALARDADRIVIARVTDVQAALTPNAESIETVVSLDVEQSLKGANGTRHTLVLPGGTVGDVQVLAGGVPQFWPDERVLVFLTTRARRPALAGLWQGKYSLIDEVATQPETGRAVPLAQLTERIAQAVASPGIQEDDGGPRVVEAPFTTFCLPWIPAQTPVPFFANPISGGPGAPAGPGFLQLVHEAVQAWQDVPAAWVSGRLAGMTSRPGTNHLDGHHDVAWADLDAFGAQVLAVNFCSMVGGLRTDSDTLVDNTGPVWSVTLAPGTLDLPSVLEHEFGHALGLGHRFVDCDGGPTTPLMCPAIRSGVRKRIQADDVEGLVALYPLAGPPPLPPGPLATRIDGLGRVSLAWATVSGALGYEIQRATGTCAGEFRAVRTVADTSAVADDAFGAGLAPALYCYRVKALGLGGDSPFSEPSVVEVPSVFHGGVFVAVAGLDGTPRGHIVTGAGPGGGPHVRAFDAQGQPGGTSFLAYAPGFAGGVRVAACDFAATGRAQIVTGAGPGGGPHVRVFLLDAAGAPTAELASFLAYDAAFAGGVFVACGDVDGDGSAEIITGAGAGGGPHVRVFRLRPDAPGGVVPVLDFFAFDPGFTGGVRVAAGTADRRDRASIVAGAGPGGGPHVRVLTLTSAGLEERGSFFAYDPSFSGGVYVAVGNVVGDAIAEIVTGADAGGGPHVRLFTAAGAPLGPGFLAYAETFTGGVRVAAGPLTGVGSDQIVTGPGPGGGPHIRIVDDAGAPRAASFMAY